MFVIRNSNQVLTYIRQSQSILSSSTYCSMGILYRRPNEILSTMHRKLRLEAVDSSVDHMQGSRSFPIFWRNMCSQQSKLGLNTKEEDPDLKYTLKKDDLGVLAGKQYFSSQDYSNHNKQALGEMDKKIKDNIKALEDDLKLAKKHTPDLVKHIKLPSENSEFAKYKEMFANYFPVKISSTEELQTIFKKEFEDFKISDLNRVPVHVMMLTLGGLAPFLVPLADLVLLHGYSASMESIQITYSSILLTTVGGIHLSSRIQDIFNNQVSKESIPSIVYPFSLAWLSLLAPSVGLVLNSTGLVLLLLQDVQKGTQRPPWYRSLRFLATSTAVVSMSVMLVGKVCS